MRLRIGFRFHGGSVCTRACGSLWRGGRLPGGGGGGGLGRGWCPGAGCLHALCGARRPAPSAQWARARPRVGEFPKRAAAGGAGSDEGWHGGCPREKTGQDSRKDTVSRAARVTVAWCPHIRSVPVLFPTQAVGGLRGASLVFSLLGELPPGTWGGSGHLPSPQRGACAACPARAFSPAREGPALCPGARPLPPGARGGRDERGGGRGTAAHPAWGSGGPLAG